MQSIHRYRNVPCLLFGIMFVVTIRPIVQESLERINDIVCSVAHQSGVEIYSVRDGHVVYSKHAHTLFTPASNVKLLTALAALALLGTEYQFQTVLALDGFIDDTTVRGDLYLQGSGDPSVTAHDIENLIVHLHEKGITALKGAFCIDTFAFDTQAFAPGVAIDDIGTAWCNPVGALMVDHKAAMINPMNSVAFLDDMKLAYIYFDIGFFIKQLFEKYGIAWSGTLRVQQTPAEVQVLAVHTSQTISHIVQHMMKYSDNVYADCIFKKIGAIVQHTVGSWESGQEAVTQFIEQTIGVQQHEYKIVDGSGLSRYNLLAPHHLVQLLTWAYAQPYFEEFLATLPVAGVDGTLANRMSEVASPVIAKTGTLGGVSSLSGYVQKEDDVFIFSIMNNGYVASPQCSSCKTDVEDAICKLLAGEHLYTDIQQHEMINETQVNGTQGV
jgi:serine-type D-Ala-D-Ala carboxypeptidase/endopeptidase (penicillin-binding protein 4)